MTPQSVYLEAGMMTDLTRHRSAVEGLPRDLESLTRVVQGLLVHEAWAAAYDFSPPPERRSEVNVRPVEQMLDVMLKLDPGPLDEPRPVERRMLGNCRDFTTLTCALLKHFGVPARARCGFGAYFKPGHYEDHWVCEVWHAEEQRWLLADAQIDSLQRKALALDFDTLDVPRDQFLVAGRAWQLCRKGERDPGASGSSTCTACGSSAATCFATSPR